MLALMADKVWSTRFFIGYQLTYCHFPKSSPWAHIFEKLRNRTCLKHHIDLSLRSPEDGEKEEPVVSLVYPLYASVRAIETKSPMDDQQWLTYWVLYSMITLFELTFSKLIECIIGINNVGFLALWQLPFLVICKAIVTCWKKDIFSKPDDILTAAEKYIEENGPEAFEKLIHRLPDTFIDSANRILVLAYPNRRGDREADSMSSNYIFSGKDYRY